MLSRANRRRWWGAGASLLVGGLLAVLVLLAASPVSPAAGKNHNIRQDLRETVRDFAIFFAAKASDFQHQPDARQRDQELRMLLQEFVAELAAGNDKVDEEATFFQLLDFITNGS